jgi:hypothetical protein
MRSALTGRDAERPRLPKNTPAAVGSSATAHARLGVRRREPPTPVMIELDISHTVVLLRDEDAELLRDRAAARAGRSAAARDLSLLLNQALTSGRRIALHRGELKALRQLLAADPHLDRLLSRFDQPANDPRLQ